jgi:chaperone modulatory protein CbpM
MMQLTAVIDLFPDLELAELAVWIERRWVQPEASPTDIWHFHDVDVARVRLIYDLRRVFETPEETMPLVLSLLDQVYELRCQLKSLTQALATQSPDVQSAVLAAMKAQPGPGDS